MAGGLFGLGAVTGPLLGLTVGGYLIEISSWHWIFLVNLPVGLLAAGLAYKYIEEPLVLFSGSYLFSLYCGVVMHYTALDTGLIFLVAGSIQIVLMPMIGKFAPRFDGRFFLACGIIVVSLSLCSLTSSGQKSWPSVAPRSSLLRMSQGSCAVCGSDDTTAAHLSRVVIQGRALDLCRPHASTVVAAMPRTFEDLCGLFVDVVLTEPRGIFDRRAPLDRREFPPRPEGRRLGIGRRAADPVE